MFVNEFLVFFSSNVLGRLKLVWFKSVEFNGPFAPVFDFELGDDKLSAPGLVPMLDNLPKQALVCVVYVPLEHLEFLLHLARDPMAEFIRLCLCQC